jgi:anti-anti-sigma factor
MPMTAHAGVADAPSAPNLDVTLHQSDPVCVIGLHGELCVDSLHVLEGEFDRLGCTSCHTVVLDLSGLEAIDEAGCNVLAGLHYYVTARGGRLTVSGANPRIRHALAETPVRHA